MPEQRAGAVVAPDRRSIHPGLPGFPWWGAVVIAATATLAGVALDAGTKELSHIFAALYVLGCLAAVLTVRQSAVFTAVIQPPLILFCAVPGAYWLFHGGVFTGVKTILINCGYPLIERFPLMLFTSAGILLIGMIRWYIGTSTQTADAPEETGPGRLATFFASLAGKFTATAKHDRTAAPAAPRRPAGERSRRTATPPRRPDPGKRYAPTRSRHVRPPVEDRPEPRRRRPPELHADQPPRRRPRPNPYQPDPPPEPRRRQPRKPGAGSIPANGTHHPISRVRYRGTNNF